jgi:acyl carrier protein
VATSAADPVRTDADPAVTPLVAELAALPRSERRSTLENVVVSQFRTSLLMDAGEELPLETSYFDLGLSSLGLTEIKQRLEALLGRTVNANVLFNSPTVGRLMTHLTDEVLTQLFTEEQVTAASASPSAPDALWSDVLEELYRA